MSRMTNAVDLCSCGNQLLSQSTALITKRIVFRRCYHRRWQTAEPDVQWSMISCGMPLEDLDQQGWLLAR
jgi:hypothetical protein